MRLHQRLSPYLEAFLRLIYPASCGVCQSVLEIEERGICSPCHAQLSESRFDFQESCLETHLEFIGDLWALFPYQSPLQEILAGIKFSKKRWLLNIFRNDLETFGKLLVSENHYDMMVPIPLDPKRLLERQFNQAELLAACLARALEIPVRKVLRKKYSTPTQSRLNQKEREVNLYQVFKVSNVRNLKGKKILLVDDILTTGATVREAARALKAHGAKRVDVFALACTSRELDRTRNS